MHLSKLSGTLRPVRDRRGVALPLALMGLVIVSLLVTGALLSSSTELAISGASRDAKANLYLADGALEAYVANRIANAADSTLSSGSRQFTAVTYDETNPWPITGTSDSARVTVREMAFQDESLGGSPELVRRTSVWSIVTEPVRGRQRGSRAVGAFINTVKIDTATNFKITAAALSGGDITVKGNATISNGEGQTDCNKGNTTNALEVTDGSRVKIDGQPTIKGTVDTTAYTKDQISEMVLNNYSIEKLVSLADLKFKASQFKRVNAEYALSGADSLFNWGCPAGMITPCPGHTGRVPVVAIDAEGGGVTINGDYGQGMLIVHNGSATFQGNFVYRGIILIENDLTIGGSSGGGQSVSFDGKIEGSVISLGSSSTVEDKVSGGATIIYNKCAIDAAAQALFKNALAQVVPTFSDRTLNWFEVVR